MVKGGTAKDDKAFQAVAKKYAGLDDGWSTTEES